MEGKRPAAALGLLGFDIFLWENKQNSLCNCFVKYATEDAC